MKSKIEFFIIEFCRLNFWENKFFINTGPVKHTKNIGFEKLEINNRNPFINILFQYLFLMPKKRMVQVKKFK